MNSLPLPIALQSPVLWNYLVDRILQEGIPAKCGQLLEELQELLEQGLLDDKTKALVAPGVARLIPLSVDPAAHFLLLQSLLNPSDRVGMLENWPKKFSVVGLEILRDLLIGGALSEQLKVRAAVAVAPWIGTTEEGRLSIDYLVSECFGNDKLAANVHLAPFLDGRLLVSLSDLVTALLGDKPIRKSARYLLDQQLAVPSSSCCADCRTRQWPLYFHLLDTVEDYSSHLFKASFRQDLQNLRVCQESRFCMSPAILFQLLTRFLTHENNHIIHHAVQTVLLDESVCACILGEIVDAKNLTDFFHLVETGFPSFYNNQVYATTFIATVVKTLRGLPNTTGQEMVQNMLSWGLGQCKPFFPIVFCYLSIVAQFVEGIGDNSGKSNGTYPLLPLSTLVSECTIFKGKRLLHFSASLRPSLMNLLRRVFAQCDWEIEESTQVPAVAIAVYHKFVEPSAVPSKTSSAMWNFFQDQIMLNPNTLVPYGVIWGVTTALMSAPTWTKQLQTGLLIAATQAPERQYISKILFRRILWAASIALPWCSEVVRMQDRLGSPDMLILVANLYRKHGYLRGYSEYMNMIERLSNTFVNSSSRTSLTTEDLTGLTELLIQLSLTTTQSTSEMDPQFLQNLINYVPSRDQESGKDVYVSDLPELAEETCTIEGSFFENTSKPLIFRLSTRDGLWDSFHYFKWVLVKKLLHADVKRKIFYSNMGALYQSLLDQFSVIGAEHVVAFNDVVREVLQNDAPPSSSRNAFLTSYCKLAMNLIDNRKNFALTPLAIDKLLSIALGERAQAEFPESANLLIQERIAMTKKLLTIGDACNPAIGRRAASLFLSTVKRVSMHSALDVPVSEILADLVCFKEGFDESETCASDSMTTSMSAEPDAPRTFDKTTPLTVAEQLELTSAYSRVLALVTLKSLNNKQIINCVLDCLVKKIEAFQQEYIAKKAPLAPFPFTPFHRIQLRVAQALCYLAPVVSEEYFASALSHALFNNLLQWPNQPDVRDYLETVAIYFCKKFGHHVIEKHVIAVLENYEGSSQVLASFVLIGAALLDNSSVQMAKDSEYMRQQVKLVHTLVPYMSSNIAYIRGISQRWLFDSLENGLLAKLGLASDSLLCGMIAYLQKNKEAIAMRKRLHLVYKQWDPVRVIESGEILSLSSSQSETSGLKSNMFIQGEFTPSNTFINAIKEGSFEALQDNWFYTRDLSSLVTDKERIDMQLNETLYAEKQIQANSQRKYQPGSEIIGSVFPAFQMDLESIERRRRVCANHLIVVTSLLEKNTNIAGLCRTAEVFGAHTLVIPSKKLLLDPTFTAMSVTAEKWINIVEVPQEDVPMYIKSMQREKGYSAVCLEQTRNSVTIEQFKFPPKTLLILGNEKTGVDPQLLPLMDSCVEIPQHGVIRSLNVHVSGAIAMWQYLISQ